MVRIKQIPLYFIFPLLLILSACGGAGGDGGSQNALPVFVSGVAIRKRMRVRSCNATKLCCIARPDPLCA